MTDAVHFARDLPVRYECDVLVVGGGPAGVAAALAAAKANRSVRLLEAHGCLGGMGTAAMVPQFMSSTDGINFLHAGVGREIHDAVTAVDGIVPPDGIRAEVLKRVYEELMVRAEVPFTYHTQFADVIVEDGRVREVICAGKSGLYAIRAKAFVDATGDGDLAAFAGAPYEKGDPDGNLMPATLCSIWSGVDWDVAGECPAIHDRRVEEAFRDGVFTKLDRHLPGMYRIGSTLGGANMGHLFNVDGTDEESLTRGYVWGRKILPEYERYYKQYLRGFENIELAASGAMLGVRETRRILGDYVLCLDDFVRRAIFDDEIGRNWYPVDIHPHRTDKKSYDEFQEELLGFRYGDGGSYGIPYRILTPQKLSNVLVSGRCVSSDRYMQSSIRTMPACFTTGQAAGAAAVMVAETGGDAHEISVRTLQARLKGMGMYLPNFD